MESSQNKPIQQMLTKAKLLQQFRLLGIQDGSVIEVHSSLKSLGYVAGGARTVVDALMDAVGYDGTIVMPAQGHDNSEPAYWMNPPIEAYLFSEVRENVPAFDGKISDMPYMGAIAANLRMRQGVLISDHPVGAFMAWGKYAKWITQSQPLSYTFAQDSPIGRMVELKAEVLLIGVGYDNCTGMHLAETHGNVRPILLQGSSVSVEGKDVWRKYLDYDYESDDFKPIGIRMEEMNLVEKRNIGDATVRLFSLSQAIKVAEEVLQKENV